MTHEALVAARHRAVEDLAAGFLAAHQRQELTEETARVWAQRYLTAREQDGWHHTASHSQPPATGPPASDDTIQRSLDQCRAAADQARRNRQEQT